MLLCFGITAEQGDGYLPDRDLQDQDGESDTQAYDQGLAERYAQTIPVFSAVTLCRDSGCSHAQEVHAEIEERENGAADRDRTEVRRAFEVTDDACVDHTE